MRALLATLLLATAAVAAPDDADDLYTKIQATKPPAFDQAKYEKDKDAYIKEYEAAAKKAAEERNKLVLEFYGKHPEDPRLPDLMVQRWLSLYSKPEKPEVLKKDIEQVAKAAKNPELKAGAAFAMIVVRMGEKDFDQIQAIKDFRKTHKESKWYEQLMMRATFELPPDKRKEAITMFVEDKPDHEFAAMFKGQLRQMEGVGKPFELTFDDAVTGKKVDIKDYRGKVVMIDWWATWCGPCVAELPHIKEIYKKYKGQGFEVIGVSLDQPEDQGGLRALKDFVAKNEVPWPQYYQGKGWDSAFSTGWGIMSIPTLFLIDKQGVLREIDVADLEESIKKLLKG